MWGHATSAERYLALCDLGQRLRSQRPDLNLFTTVTSAVPDIAPPDGCPVPLRLTSDHPLAVRQFLDHWQPDLCLWTGGNLMPNLICTAGERDLPMILADLGESDLPRRRPAWLADVTRPCLEQFTAVMANSPAAAAQLRRIGLPGERITVTARLRSGASPPACPESVVAATSQDLAGRPVWLAAHVRAEEIDAILSAHRDALRLLHRLVLVVVLAEPQDNDRLRARLAESGLRHADWYQGDRIGEETQVLMSENSGDLGLWYRVAPLSFMASSLSTGAGGCSPFEAAALGSAVLYGPNVRHHTDAYERLAAAGAARAVRDARSLAKAVVQLAAPDQAAAMALAGWQTITESATLTDLLVEMIQDQLDRRERRDAGA